MAAELMRLFGTALVMAALLAGHPLSGQERQRVEPEEAVDYFEKWLKEDVVYIISEDEKNVFRKLTTAEEKEQFIEQFWFRRDPDPRTPVNEFKEEHYRRIAYANERFASGLPGWLTDRGRIYILHGPPAEIESRPSGGMYMRQMHEGGGTTSTFPFEVWRYRHIEGVGSDIELEFVDPTMSGEYRLARHPDEKDALLFVPGAGLTMAEEMGLASKAERPFFSPGNRENYPLMHLRAKDNPFERYETYTQVQRPRPIKYDDLKELVEINVSFDNLPFETRQDFFRLNDDQVLVPVTLELENKNLTFKREGDRHVARVGVYGLVTSLTNRIVEEFEHDMVATYSAEELEKGLQGRSIYQKVMPLASRMRYKLDLVVKDLHSGKVGTVRTAVIPPVYEKDRISASEIILAGLLEPVEGIPSHDEMFVIGDVKVRPVIQKSFLQGGVFGIYLHVYNVALDQTSFEPSLRIVYRLFREGRPVAEVEDISGTTIQYASAQRVVLVERVSLEGMEPGAYQLEVEVEDRIQSQTVSRSQSFRVEERARALASN